MVKLELKPILNKKNKQITFSIPKKKVSKKFLEKACSGKSIKILFED